LTNQARHLTGPAGRHYDFSREHVLAAGPAGELCSFLGAHYERVSPNGPGALPDLAWSAYAALTLAYMVRADKPWALLA
jgi:hypothetical protein